MTDIEAMDILRAQGHAVGAPDPKTGVIRVWFQGKDHYVEVKSGRDLVRLAEGSITMEDLDPAQAPSVERTRKVKHDFRQARAAH